MLRRRCRNGSRGPSVGDHPGIAWGGEFLTLNIRELARVPGLESGRHPGETSPLASENGATSGLAPMAWEQHRGPGSAVGRRPPTVSTSTTPSMAAVKRSSNIVGVASASGPPSAVASPWVTVDPTGGCGASGSSDPAIHSPGVSASTTCAVWPLSTSCGLRTGWPSRRRGVGTFANRRRRRRRSSSGPASRAGRPCRRPRPAVPPRLHPATVRKAPPGTTRRPSPPGAGGT